MDLLRPLVEIFLPGECYEDVVLNFDVSNVACMKIALSKGLGYGMILGGSLVKLPQILKVTAAQSAQGLSIASVCLDLTAVTATTAYNYSAQYPFSAWGEGVFLMVETALILALALHYSSKTTQAVISSIIFSIICFFIVGKMVPINILWFGQLISAPVAISGKLIQARENHNAGHTGQLSMITVSLLFLGCVARIFTSIQETGDSLIIGTYVLASLANFVLVAQVLFYWDATNKVLSTTSQKKKE
jgi:mannose-P-dolichol utilization defect protein 1